MKTTFLIIRVLIALFLCIAVVVHLVGPFFPDKLPEPLWSHAIHFICYSICLFTFLRPVKFRLPFYLIASVYPVFYHSRCFFTQLVDLHKFNSICFEVIVILPLAALLIFTENKKAE